MKRLEGVDILVNNAAFYFIIAVDQAEPEKVRQLLDINIFGTWLGISKVVPAMAYALRARVLAAGSKRDILVLMRRHQTRVRDRMRDVLAWGKLQGG